jgi:hypothetical protein
MSSSSNYFLSFVRSGLARMIEGNALAAGQLRASKSLVPVRLSVADEKEATPITLYLRGPADVSAVNASPRERGSIVRRVFPRPDSKDCASGIFVAMDFDEVDFPWKYTPVAASGSQLAPWICLLVMGTGTTEATLRSAGRGQERDSRVEQIVDIKAGTPMPDLAESWVSAHVQIASALAEQAGYAISKDGSLDPAETSRLLKERPELATSRLLSLRRVEKGKGYIALLVPAYQAGVDSGLGRTPGPGVSGSDPAWVGAVAPAEGLTLPVYASWNFETSASPADFEELVRQIRPGSLPTSAGGFPGYVRSVQSGTYYPLQFEGMIAAPGSQHRPWPGDAGDYVTELGIMLRAGLATAAGPAPYQDPFFMPPVYGRWHARVTSLGSAHTRWVEDLNLDPRYRHAASVGTGLVQMDQETLVAEAWAKVGEVREANRALRAAQLGAQASDSILSRVASADLAQRLSMTSPVHARVPGAAQTVERELRGTELPSGALSPVFLRLSRPGGPLLKRAAATRKGPLVPSTMVAGWATKGASRIVPAIRDGAVRWSTMAPAGEAKGVAARPVARPPAGGPGVAGLAGVPPAAGPAPAGLPALLVKLNGSFAAPVAQRLPGLPAADLQSAWNRVVATLDPHKAIGRALFERIRIPGASARTRERLHPVMAYPTMEHPVSAALAKYSPESFLPGIGEIGRDMVVCGETNPVAVHALLAGTNHEMGRELLWRGYPTDCRGTYFRRFWDRRDAAGKPLDDISPMHSWGKSLGLNPAPGGPTTPEAVLIVRSALFHKFPATHVYAVSAVRQGGVLSAGDLDDAARHVFPTFQGWLGPEIRYFGFPFTPAAAISGDGYYFIFEEQPGQPRFGLDEGSAGVGPLSSWDNLTWSQLGTASGAYMSVAPAPAVAAPPPADPAGRPVGNPAWASSAGSMAAILLQRPVRATVHARRLIR